MGDDPWYLLKRAVQVGSLRHVIEPGERTPYPVIIEEPLLQDILGNMKLPELVPIILAFPFGSGLAYSLTFGMYRFPVVRRKAFTLVFFTTVLSAGWLGLKGSYYKLTGFENNGLRWKFSEARLKKYKFTGELENDRFAMLLKRKDIDSSKQY